MAVDSTHEDYAKRLPQWKVIRDVIEGEDSVKEAGTAYLPKLGGQEKDRYDAYKMRAMFYNATSRTLEGLSGMIFRKPPRVRIPETMQPFHDDATMSGVPLESFAAEVVEEVLSVGRSGGLVDYPRVEDRGLTKLDAERMNLRPFWVLYKAEQIINWSVGLVGNKTTLLQVRLWEEGVEEGDDEFSVEDFTQIRVLELVPEVGYQQRVFRKTADGKDWEQYGETVVPRLGGKPLKEIPFVFFGARDLTPSLDKPPLIDLVRVNLSHYRTSADLEHGTHFTALPTPYCFGISDKEIPDTIGPEVIWTSMNKDVNAGMLEFTGSGLSSLETRQERKEQQMAALGARMLEAPKRQAEAAETAATHRAGENSVLASVANTISAGITQMLSVTRDWMGESEEVSFKLNTDFLPIPMSPAAMVALLKMVQGRAISHQVFFENLQKGEIIDAEHTFEDEELRRSEDALSEILDDDEEEDHGINNGPPVAV